jgi:hypothetical protein
MHIGTVSPSKLGRLRLCEARVDAQLHDDGYDEEQGEPARIGILAHEAAKLWYRGKARDKKPEDILYTDRGECFRAAIESCSKKLNPATKQIESELPHEASELAGRAHPVRSDHLALQPRRAEDRLRRAPVQGNA